MHAADPAEEGMLAMHHVGEWGAAHAEQADLLLDHGADINARSDCGWTPLDYAIDRSRVEIAAHLRARGGKESDER